MDKVKIEERALYFLKIFRERGGEIFKGEKEQKFMGEWTKRLSEREQEFNSARESASPEVVELQKRAFERMFAQSENIALTFELVRDKEWHELLKEVSLEALGETGKFLLGFV